MHRLEPRLLAADVCIEPTCFPHCDPHRDDYTHEQHIAHVAVVARGGGLAPEDGTLTRTMKPRRQHIMQVHTNLAKCCNCWFM